MRAALLGIIALLCATADPGTSRAAGSPDSFAIQHVDVFDGRTMQRREDVIVRDGVIARVGRHLSIPDGLTVIEGKGRTLLPGLIDSHVHSWGSSRSDALRFGVTTELDMFMDWHALADARTQRESLAQTDLSDLWSSGTLATAAGGHGTEYGLPVPTLKEPGEAQAWVDARVAEGSDYIKIILEPGSAAHPLPTLSPATVAALVAAVHHDGRKAWVHVQTLESARVAVTAGADGLAHIFYDEPPDASFVRLAQEHHILLIATLAVFSAVSCGPTAGSLAHDPALVPYLSKEQTTMLGGSFGICSPTALPTAIGNVRIMHEAGIPILAGTDAGNPGTAHGVSLLGEIGLLTQAGLTPLEALAAATSVPAARFGLTDRGRIARGTRADLVLVDGDPSRDPAAVRQITAVWKNGYAVRRDRPADGDASGGFPAKFQLVQGPLVAQSPGAVYAGHISNAGGSGALDVTIGADGLFKGSWGPVAAAAGSEAPPDLSKEWDLLYGAGYYQAHVRSNRFYSRAIMSGGGGATVITEIIGDDSYKFIGAARDTRGNIYKVTFGD